MPVTFDYRQRALECLGLAKCTHDPQIKVWAVELAALLRRVADKAERNRDLSVSRISAH
jgi:hypothetical protein